MLFKISNSFFYTQKVAYFVFKDSSSPVKASSLIRSARPTYAVSPTKPDLNMTSLRCTTDHHAVTPPPQHTTCGERDHPRPFLNRLENLSRSPRPLTAGPTNPCCILDQHTLSPIKARSLPIRLFFQSGGWSGLWCERAFGNFMVDTGTFAICSNNKWLSLIRTPCPVLFDI